MLSYENVSRSRGTRVARFSMSPESKENIFEYLSINNLKQIWSRLFREDTQLPFIAENLPRKYFALFSVVLKRNQLCRTYIEGDVERNCISNKGS